MKKKLNYWVLLFVSLMYNATIYAQGCAMCKTTVESNTDNGQLAKSLNTGILYLMAVPYLVLMLGAYFFFKKQIDAKVKMWRNKYFPAKELQ